MTQRIQIEHARGVKCSRERAFAIAQEESAVLNIAGLLPEMIFDDDRRVAVAYLRARVIQRLYATRLFCLNGIARAVGLKDHSSVLHNVRRDLSVAPTGLTKRIAPEPRPLPEPAAKKPAPIIASPLLPSMIPPPPLSRLMAGRA